MEATPGGLDAVGAPVWPEPEHGQSDLARLQPAAASQRDVLSCRPDPLFIDKVRDIVGLYLNPPDKALVLCVDEKAQIQALDRSQPLLPMRPGQVERRTHDYGATAPRRSSRPSTPRAGA